MNTLAQQTISFTFVDYFIVAVILLSTLISLMRGFISEAVSLATWIIAAVVAFNFTPSLSPILSRFIHTPSLLYMVSFLIIFFVILIIGSILNHFLSVVIRSTGLSGTNRLLGMVFGFARGVLLIAIFILFAKMTSFVRVTWWQESYLIPYFQGIVAWLQQFIPAHFNNLGHYFATPTGGTE